MRIRPAWLVLFFVFATAARARAADPYHLALGDSLAIGVQPGATGAYVATNQGYADDLYAFYRTRVPALRLAKLGCSGETTSSMIAGPPQSPCSYTAGSQLLEAVAFLHTHRVVLITIDIGADDLLKCFNLVTRQIDSGCVTAALTSAPNFLALILSALRAAAPNAVIVGMNYYDPFLAAVIFGPAGQALATASLPLIQGFDQSLGLVYQALQVPVADVASLFRIEDGQRPTPLNVALVLAWTWMGAPPPRGPDVHPNAVGYFAIASAFAKAVAAP